MVPRSSIVWYSASAVPYSTHYTTAVPTALLLCVLHDLGRTYSTILMTKSVLFFCTSTQKPNPTPQHFCPPRMIYTLGVFGGRQGQSPRVSGTTAFFILCLVWWMLIARKASREHKCSYCTYIPAHTSTCIVVGFCTSLFIRQKSGFCAATGTRYCTYY